MVRASLASRAASTFNSTLAASWYGNKAIYELERRAIFSQHWLLTTHVSRMTSPGRYVRYNTAGYPFFLIRDQNGCINAFLNACRHRAFPLLQKDEGKASQLVCKFHGWTYGIDGSLSRAPEFDDVEWFQKAEYPLFKLHTKVDRQGFIYVNFDADQMPNRTWNEQFSGADQQHRLEDMVAEDYIYHHSWNVKCDFNWKALVDSFNECYHCRVGHPQIANDIDLRKYHLVSNSGSIQHEANIEKMADLTISYFFPNAYYIRLRDAFYIGRIVPTSPTTVSMEYEFYRHKDPASAYAAEEIEKFFKQIESEDQELCRKTQQGLSSDIYVAGPLHPDHEKALLHFKNLLVSTVREHHEKELSAGRIIEPAKRFAGAEASREEIAFCDGLCLNESLGRPRDSLV